MIIARKKKDRGACIATVWAVSAGKREPVSVIPSPVAMHVAPMVTLVDQFCTHNAPFSTGRWFLEVFT